MFPYVLGSVKITFFFLHYDFLQMVVFCIHTNRIDHPYVNWCNEMMLSMFNCNNVVNIHHRLFLIFTIPLC